MDELKPCPFCGGQATYFSEECEDGSKDWGIACMDCGAEINCFTTLEDAIEHYQLPKADVAPVVHGRWEDGQLCSVCDFDRSYFRPRFNYCPNCGAKMDLEESNEA